MTQRSKYLWRQPSTERFFGSCVNSGLYSSKQSTLYPSFTETYIADFLPIYPLLSTLSFFVHLSCDLICYHKSFSCRYRQKKTGGAHMRFLLTEYGFNIMEYKVIEDQEDHFLVLSYLSGNIYKVKKGCDEVNA